MGDQGGPLCTRPSCFNANVGPLPPSTPPTKWSRHFTDGVRAFAIKQLGRAADKDVELYLLQLVQLLRYEPWGESGSANSSGSSRDGSCSIDGKEPAHMPPLARFLIDRASNSLALANALLWFLKAEAETDETVG